MADKKQRARQGDLWIPSDASMGIAEMNALNWSLRAAPLLQSVWPAPALDYSPEWLEWQMSFEGSGPWIGIGDEALGWSAAGGATAREVLTPRGERERWSVLSFIAVSEALRGQGWAKKVYAQLLEKISGPVLTYAPIHSAGARLIEHVYPAAGFRLQEMNPCAIYAKSRKLSARPEGWTVEPLQAPPHGKAWPGVLQPAPGEREWERWCADPRPHWGGLALGQGGGGQSAEVWGWFVEQRVRGVDGVRGQWVLEAWGARGDSSMYGAGLEALIHGLERAGHELPAFVQANNLSPFAGEQLRRWGWRQIGGSFQSWCAVRDGEPPACFASTMPVI